MPRAFMDQNASVKFRKNVPPVLQAMTAPAPWDPEVIPYVAGFIWGAVQFAASLHAVSLAVDLLKLVGYLAGQPNIMKDLAKYAEETYGGILFLTTGKQPSAKGGAGGGATQQAAPDELDPYDRGKIAATLIGALIASVLVYKAARQLRGTLQEALAAWKARKGGAAGAGIAAGVGEAGRGRPHASGTEAPAPSETEKAAEHAAEGLKGKTQADIEGAAKKQLKGAKQASEQEGKRFPKGWRLPHNGRWSGEPGDSNFLPDNPGQLGLHAGETVPFSEGYPDFSKWAKESFDVQGLNGAHDHDLKIIWEDLAERHNLPSPNAARNWLTRNALTPHHAGGSKVELVPTPLHRGIRHTGGAWQLRNQ